MALIQPCWTVFLDLFLSKDGWSWVSVTWKKERKGMKQEKWRKGGREKGRKEEGKKERSIPLNIRFSSTVTICFSEFCNLSKQICPWCFRTTENCSCSWGGGVGAEQHFSHPVTQLSTQNGDDQEIMSRELYSQIREVCQAQKQLL